MKRGFILWLLVAGVVTAHGAWAHVLSTDGAIGAVMHTDPDDEAIVGEPAAFFFEFKDTTGKFKPQDCTCTASLEKDGQTFFNQPLFAKSLDTTGTDAVMNYTFAQPGIYQLIAHGEPKTAGAFSPFTLRYDVQVVAGATTPSTAGRSQSSGWLATHFLHIVGAIILVVVTLGMIIYERIRKPVVSDDKP